MSVLATKAFWDAAGERAAKSVAQGALAGGITTAVFTDRHVLLGVLLTGVVTGAASLLTSIASVGAGGNGPSLTTSEQLLPPGSTVVTPPPDHVADDGEDPAGDGWTRRDLAALGFVAAGLVAAFGACWHVTS